MISTGQLSSDATMPSQARNKDGEEATGAAELREPAVVKPVHIVSGEGKEEKHQYLTGLKLFASMISITLVGFLMLLDTSIVSTVSKRYLSASLRGRSC